MLSSYEILDKYLTLPSIYRNVFIQKLLDDLQWNRLYCGWMSWLLAHPPTPLRMLRKRDNLLTREEGAGGGGAKSYDQKKTWSTGPL
jgi:hypothetical protein